MGCLRAPRSIACSAGLRHRVPVRQEFDDRAASRMADRANREPGVVGELSKVVDAAFSAEAVREHAQVHFGADGHHVFGVLEDEDLAVGPRRVGAVAQDAARVVVVPVMNHPGEDVAAGAGGERLKEATSLRAAAIVKTGCRQRLGRGGGRCCEVQHRSSEPWVGAE